MSRVGKVFCMSYAFIIILCFAMAYSEDGDFKGQYVFLQLPIALQMSVVHAIGLSPALQNLTWFGAYVILGLPTFLFLYFIGWFIDRCHSRLLHR